MEQSIIENYITNEVKQHFPNLNDEEKSILIDNSIKFFNDKISFSDLESLYKEYNLDTALVNKFNHIKTAKPPTMTIKTIEKNNQPLFPSHKKKSNSWSEYEDIRLLAAIMRYGPKDWKQIAEFVSSGRTASQCNQRWCRALDPTINHAQWTQEEDAKLLKAVELLGKTNWCKVAKALQGRTDLQCRYRYYQIMKNLPNDMKQSFYNITKYSINEQKNQKIEDNSSNNVEKSKYSHVISIADILNKEINSDNESNKKLQILHHIPPLLFIRKPIDH